LIAGIRAVSNGIARAYGMPEDQLPLITMKGGSTPLIKRAPDFSLAAALLVAHGVLRFRCIACSLGEVFGYPLALSLINARADCTYKDEAYQGLQNQQAAADPLQAGTRAACSSG